MRRPAIHLTVLIFCAMVAHPAAADDDAFDYKTWRQFWSFKPVTKPSLPRVTDKTWGRNPIDAFILAKLEAHKLQPSPRADKRTLIRRATFDLTGLPPTLAEIDAFLADDAPDAFEKLIKRLLDSPHYGERYGRHWLDVVRYEQGKVKLPGVKNTRGELAFRDYVVRSFNQDKPYDRILTEHLAGDLLPPTPNREQYFDQITAPAFLSIGNWFDECTDPNRLRLDIIDEQINAVSKAFMGLTISCARCHDHKFDPITDEDYYALASVFASTRIVDTFNENWKDGRIRLTREMATPAEARKIATLERESEIVRDQLIGVAGVAYDKVMNDWSTKREGVRKAAAALPRVEVVRFEAEQFAGQSNLKVVEIAYGGRKFEVLGPQTPGEQWVKYEVEVPVDGRYQVELLASAGRASRLKLLVDGRTHDIESHPFENALDHRWSAACWLHSQPFDIAKGRRTLRLELVDKDGAFPHIDRLRLVQVTDEWTEAATRAAAEWKVSVAIVRAVALDADLSQLTPAEVLLRVPVGEEPSRAAALKDQIAEATRFIDSHSRLIAVTDDERPTDLPVHIGGDTYRVSKSIVPRGVPVLFEHAVKPPEMPDNSSGRLELARWLTNANHPLTARVMVNRLWQWHFGRGIVDSANDFGSRGTPPSHPDLLDWLAATFVEEKWSMKKLHYLIVTSATYQQAGTTAPASRHVLVHGASATGHASSPALLASFPRRRLEVEALYDAMLATTGKVGRQPSGAPVDFDRSADRMMYVLTANRSPVGLGGEIRKMFGVFGYDPTGEPIEKRDASTTAAQALFWLNSPIPKHFAGVFAKLLLADAKLTDDERIKRAYRIALTREPDEQTLADIRGYLETCENDGMKREEAWMQVCQAIYASSAFRYLE